MRVDLATILSGMGHVLDRDFVCYQEAPDDVRYKWLAQTVPPTEAEIDAAADGVYATIAAKQADNTLYQADRADLRTQYATAVTRLEQIRDAASLNNTQAVTAIKDLAAVQIRMLKYIRGL